MGMRKKWRRLPPGEVDCRAIAEHRIDRAIADRFRASAMSDAKWRRLFITLAREEAGVSGYRWKFVDSEQIFETSLIQARDLDKAHLVDGWNQPFVYRDIEWVEALTDHRHAAIIALVGAGEFAVEETTIGLRIRGYL